MRLRAESALFCKTMQTCFDDHNCDSDAVTARCLSAVDSSKKVPHQWRSNTYLSTGSADTFRRSADGGAQALRRRVPPNARHVMAVGAILRGAA